MKIKNVCDICSTAYLAPIDLQWTYQLNDFVFRSLVTHTGLPVLWTLGFLQKSFGTGGFCYIPEVDLYENLNDPDRRKEIDILCVLGGKFIAAEVKLSASQLTQQPDGFNSFVDKMNKIQPDIALISCEKYCASEIDVESTKAFLKTALIGVKERLQETIKFEFIVSTDVPEFTQYSYDLGWIGERTAGIE